MRLTDSDVNAFRYLCRRGARRYLRPGLELDDLEQIAMLGLLKAADRYDARGGTPFEAFAWMKIRSELGHHVRDHEQLVRPPRSLRGLEQRRSSEWERLAQLLGHEPSELEVGAATAIPIEMLHQLAKGRASAQWEPLDESVLTWSECNEREVDADDAIALRLIVGSLPSDERRVVYGIFWLDLTRAEVGRRIGVSAKVVSRLLLRALDRLASALNPAHHTSSAA